MKYFAALMFSAALALATQAPAQATWSLLPDDAACLIEHLNDYFAADGEPIIIMPHACPIVDRMEALRSLQQNSGAQPHVTVVPEGSAIDQVIVYTHAELNCLRELRLEMSGLPVRLPQNPCD